MAQKIKDLRQNAITRLPARKRAFVTARAEGKSIKLAAAQAGIAKSTGGQYDRADDVQAAYRLLMRRAVSPEKLVKLIKGGCEAKRSVYSPDGKKVTERADWHVRRPYIEMAAKHAGYYEEKNAAGGAQIVIAVNHIGQTSAPNQRIVEASTETVEVTPTL